MTRTPSPGDHATTADDTHDVVDAPITLPSEDKYNTIEFGKILANFILKQSSPCGTVIAVLGPWGSGKSSAINLAKHEINNESDNSIKVIEVDCWAYRGEDAIVRGLLRATYSAFTVRSLKSQVAMNGIIQSAAGFKLSWEAVAGFTTAFVVPLIGLYEIDTLFAIFWQSFLFVSDALVISVGSVSSNSWSYELLSVMLAMVGFLTIYALCPRRKIRIIVQKVSSILSTLLCYCISLVSKTQTIEEHQQVLVGELKANNEEARILIVVDDLDRLNPVEAHTALRVVRTLGNLPNVIFLLAFDPDILDGYYGKIYESKRESYLDKVVNFRFHLTPPIQKELTTVLEGQIIEQIFREQDSVDETRLTSILNNLLNPLVGSPRDVVRFIGSWSFTFEAMAGEVDPIDFLAIETLRIFHPRVYAGIHGNQRFFVLDPELSGKTVPPRVVSVIECFLEKYDEEDEKRRALEALSIVFPMYGVLLNNSLDFLEREVKFGVVASPLNVESIRVCSGYRFESYFRFGIPSAGEKQS